MEDRDTPGRRVWLDRADRWLDGADLFIYLLVSALFVLAAASMAFYALFEIVHHLNASFPVRLVEFINGLLLVLIIMEVLGTVRSYLATGHTSLRPFLYIGIISATRRILAIGAETTLGEVNGNTAFQHAMIDLSINAAVVLALSLALFLLGRRPAGTDDELSEGRPLEDSESIKPG